MLDSSVFKKLAHNDTGAAKGHQGGIVIPKEISAFFPPLPDTTSSSQPTVDAILNAELLVNGRLFARAETRYQHQTWGGKRSPERRLTDNLGPLRNQATADDIVLFSKDLSDDSFLRVELITKGTRRYDTLNSMAGERRWGVTEESNPPVSVSELDEADAYLSQIVAEAGSAFNNTRQEVEVTTIRKARNRAFRNTLLILYDFRCAFTGRKFVSPLSSKTVGLDAAHVVPVAQKGSDHPVNGLPLTKDLHWSFDTGLLGVDQNRKIFVPDRVAGINGNEFLRDLHGTPVIEANYQPLTVSDEAFAWHRENVLIN